MLMVVTSVVLFLGIILFSSNIRLGMDILWGSKSEFYFEGVEHIDNCMLKQKVMANKDYFMNLSEKLSKQNVHLLVSTDIETLECMGSMYGIWVEGLSSNKACLFMLLHGTSLKDIQYITQLGEYTANEFKETIELKEILNLEEN